MNDVIVRLLTEIYGASQAEELAEEIGTLVAERRSHLIPPENRGRGDLPLDETDAFLITYGDSFRRDGTVPLQGLREFADRKLTGIISGIHILPFSLLLG